MLEVVFSDSAAGSLQVAIGNKGNYAGGAIGIICRRADGQEPSPEEIEKLKRQAEERERQAWAGAVPMEGSRKDILSFPLCLGVGEVSETGIGAQREAAFRMLMGVYPDGGEAAGELLRTARRSLAALQERAPREPLRIWAGPAPDEACGLCWLAEQLRPLGLDKVEVRLARLPEYEERPDGCVVLYQSWADIEPHQWGRLAAGAERIPPNALRAMANRWKELQGENAPLRALLSGQLVSLPESAYDPFILRELDAMPGEFQEAVLVGRVLGRHRLGVSDGWVALRIERFLREGRLEAATQPEGDAPLYHRILRKTRQGS